MGVPLQNGRCSFKQQKAECKLALRHRSRKRVDSVCRLANLRCVNGSAFLETWLVSTVDPPRPRSTIVHRWTNSKKVTRQRRNCCGPPPARIRPEVAHGTGGFKPHRYRSDLGWEVLWTILGEVPTSRRQSSAAPNNRLF